MCGICGAIGFETPPEAALIVRRMMRAMIHRGPDGEGLFVAPRAAVGMRRLSIIDLPGGNQPIWNEAGTLAVIFNGEVYNHHDLRRSLESAGHVFRSQSDTEVIVHAYETWGEDCVRHLRGMFALAILEMPKGRQGPSRRVFLARDCMGIKPLYYAQFGEKFLFASEVRALLASNCLDHAISSSALASYLLFGSVGEPESLVEGIYSLPPGHYGFVACDAPSNSFVPKSHWGFDEAFSTKHDVSDDISPALRLRERLEDSVRYHLEADVPLGIFLSSGVDSTSLAAAASRQRPDIRTFTVVFPEQGFSEGEIASQTARRLGTVHSELLLSGDEMRARLDEAVDAFDQPSMDGVNTFFVSRAAHEAGLKVALSGLGSDELFGGYDIFRFIPRLARLVTLCRALPAPLRRSAASVIQTIAAFRMAPDAARKLAAAVSSPRDFSHPYFFARALFPPQIVTSLLSDDHATMKDSLWYQSLLQDAQTAASLDSFAAVSWLETRTYLSNTLLRDTDTMSMRHSLEVRVPFLDRPLIEWTLRLPAATKQKNGARKPLLIEALGDLLPPEIIAQRKRTFTLPWEAWLRGPLGARVESSLMDLCAAIRPVIKENMVKKVWQDFLAGRTSWSRPWSLFVLNEWTRRNLEPAAQTVSHEETRVVSSTV